MDEMKIKLSTKFMRNMIAKIISKIIFKKFGVKVGLQLNEIETEMRNGKIHFHINVDGEIDQNAFMKLNNIIDEEES